MLSIATFFCAGVVYTLLTRNTKDARAATFYMCSLHVYGVSFEARHICKSKKEWPTSGKHILAQFDDDSIIVYQAYNPLIAEAIVNSQNFHSIECQKSGYSMSRMTWIKTNFLWMMFRSGWATKPNQERILALRLRRDGFEMMLSKAVSSKTGGESSKGDGVRLQWDPDHHPSGECLSKMKFLVIACASLTVALAQTGATGTPAPTGHPVDPCQICDYIIQQAAHHLSKGYTEDQLQKELVSDCQSLTKFYGPGVVADCTTTVTANIDTIYNDLKAGKEGHSICIDIGKCVHPSHPTGATGAPTVTGAPVTMPMANRAYRRNLDSGLAILKMSFMEPMSFGEEREMSTFHELQTVRKEVQREVPMDSSIVSSLSDPIADSCAASNSGNSFIDENASFVSQDSGADSFLRPSSPNSTANTSIISTASQKRRKALKTSTDSGLPSKCRKCLKVIEFRNRSRHSAFHSKIFRFKCSDCEYKAHLAQNVRTHIRMVHKGVGEVVENKSLELANEYLRTYAECFGEKKTRHSLEIFSGRKSVDEASYFDDSGVTVGSFDSTFSSQGSYMPDEFEKTLEIIGEQTVSARTMESIITRGTKTYKCTRCARFVGRTKIPCHAAIHSSRKRFRCSECGVCHHSRANLKTHIRLCHENKGEVLDEADDALIDEIKSLERECFPDAALVQRTRRSAAPRAQKDTVKKTLKNQKKSCKLVESAEDDEDSNVEEISQEISTLPTKRSTRNVKSLDYENFNYEELEHDSADESD
ncbi:unnamed protein product, partial [Mesorhabditis belari]|uniref:C2H2-type domain-containing protein n=1 Tax=Mesorhabditis belari TaxID=2138241 RepID=A0AAF3EK47_9BILA